jgi:hypothetical protein
VPGGHCACVVAACVVAARAVVLPMPAAGRCGQETDWPGCGVMACGFVPQACGPLGAARGSACCAPAWRMAWKVAAH